MSKEKSNEDPYQPINPGKDRWRENKGTKTGLTWKSGTIPTRTDRPLDRQAAAARTALVGHREKCREIPNSSRAFISLEHRSMDILGLIADRCVPYRHAAIRARGSKPVAVAEGDDGRFEKS
jgi:hypothetical protein